MHNRVARIECAPRSSMNDALGLMRSSATPSRSRMMRLITFAMSTSAKSKSGHVRNGKAALWATQAVSLVVPRFPGLPCGTPDSDPSSPGARSVWIAQREAPNPPPLSGGCKPSTSVMRTICWLLTSDARSAVGCKPRLSSCSPTGHSLCTVSMPREPMERSPGAIGCTEAPIRALHVETGERRIDRRRTYACPRRRARKDKSPDHREAIEALFTNGSLGSYKRQSGSDCWTRTSDPAVNSRLLYH